MGCALRILKHCCLYFCLRALNFCLVELFAVPSPQFLKRFLYLCLDHVPFVLSLSSGFMHGFYGLSYSSFDQSLWHVLACRKVHRSSMILTHQRYCCLLYIFGLRCRFNPTLWSPLNFPQSVLDVVHLGFLRLDFSLF